MGRQTLAPRSKSQASDAISDRQSRVGAEARRPVARRPESTAVETRDFSTQTDETLDELDYDLNWSELDQPEDGDASKLTESGGPGSSTFLSQHIRMQAELEMALRSQMEMIAEHEATRSAAAATLTSSRSAVGLNPSPPQGRPHGRRQFGALRPLAGRSAGRKSVESHGDGSDGECHGEDDEVRSLSLSEDGPVIRRSLSEPSAERHAAAAPDPIAMLSDGQRNVSHGARGVNAPSGTSGTPLAATSLHSLTPLPASPNDEDEGCTSSAIELEETSEPVTDEPLGSDRSAPNDSDHSAAPTHTAGLPSNHVGEQALIMSNLIPILSKVTGSAPKDVNPLVHAKEPKEGGLPLGERDVGATASAPAREPMAREDPALVGSARQMLQVVQETPGLANASQSRFRRRDWVPTARLKVPALRSAGANVQALDLSQIRLPPLGNASDAVQPSSARSDVSFGSAQSAFTCCSSTSPSSSQMASPRNKTLKGTVSMPSLTTHHLRYK